MTEQSNLPPLPEPKLYPAGTYQDGVLTYNADQMSEYGQLCREHALEEAATACVKADLAAEERGESPTLTNAAHIIRSLKWPPQ